MDRKVLAVKMEDHRLSIKALVFLPLTLSSQNALSHLVHQDAGLLNQQTKVSENFLSLSIGW
jgi:hypothetical protein